MLRWLFGRKSRDGIDKLDRWFVELDEQPVALITNPADADLFWFTWDVVALGETPAPSDLWDYTNDHRRSFRHAATGERNSHTIPAAQGVLPNGRVMLRGPLRSTT
jgi:hypothetical protein